MRLRGLAAGVVLFAVLAAAQVSSHLAVQDARRDLMWRTSSRGVHLPPALLRIVAGEFKGLVSDYLLLEVGSFLGFTQDISSEDWDNVVLSLEQCLSLDPYFQQTYIFVQGHIAWEAKRPQDALRLLDVSRRHRPWDWRPGYFMGFDAYFFLKDYAKAAEYFFDAAKIEGAPVLLAVLGGRFAAKSGRVEAAVALLQSMLEEVPPEDVLRVREIRMRMEALQGVAALERALCDYIAVFREKPNSLDDLITSGFLSAIPSDPYGEGYTYDPETGEIGF